MVVAQLSVSFGGRGAVVEVPAGATLEQLAALLAQMFAVEDPRSIKVLLPGAEDYLKLKDHPHAKLRDVGIHSGCQLKMKTMRLHHSKHHASEDEHDQQTAPPAASAGAAAAPPPPPSQPVQAPVAAASRPAAGASSSQPQPEFAKGKVVLYRQRDGSMAQAKVVDIDYSVLPFSYGIEIDGHYRETEANRLAHLPQQ